MAEPKSIGLENYQVPLLISAICIIYRKGIMQTGVADSLLSVSQ
nr:MAG TPA: hypothetical protein [Caudoviricetes sp.]